MQVSPPLSPLPHCWKLLLLIEAASVTPGNSDSGEVVCCSVPQERATSPAPPASIQLPRSFSAFHLTVCRGSFIERLSTSHLRTRGLFGAGHSKPGGSLGSR